VQAPHVPATQSTVTVTFNGQDVAISFQPQEAVQAVLERALNAFNVTSNRHLMSLFTEAGTELTDSMSMQAAGINPGDVLVLRQSKVKGG
jgi:hypothetical protein